MSTRSLALRSAAWRLEDPASLQSINGTLQTTGDERDVNAYRSKLQGIHATLLAIAAVCSFYHITNGAVTLGCNNLGGVHQSNADWLKINQSTKHADLIQAIRRTTATLPISVTWVHIGGHQDANTAFHQLPRMAQLNVTMDHLAKNRLRSLLNSSSLPSRAAPLLHEGWRCIINDVKVTSDPRPAIRKALLTLALDSKLTYMTEKYSILQRSKTTWIGRQSKLPPAIFHPCTSSGCPNMSAAS